MFYMAIFHSKPEYIASNENLGLQWSVESMINTLAYLVFPYGQAEIAYFYSENLPPAHLGLIHENGMILITYICIVVCQN